MTNTMTNPATAKHYAKRDHQAQGTYYINHVNAMTSERLHVKSAIAAELAHRDMEIDRLHAALVEGRCAINSMKVEAETAGAGGDEQMLQEACETISNEGLAASMAIEAALAAPAQAVLAPGVSSDAVAQVLRQIALAATSPGDHLNEFQHCRAALQTMINRAATALDDGRLPECGWPELSGAPETAGETAAPAQAGEYESLAQTWELNASEYKERQCGVSADYNKGIAEAMHACAQELRAARGAAQAAPVDAELWGLAMRYGMPVHKWNNGNAYWAVKGGHRGLSPAGALYAARAAQEGGQHGAE